MAQVSYGTITITDTTDIEDVYLIYKGSSSNTTAPSITWSGGTNDWKTDITQVTGDYIWAITVFKRSGIAITSSNYTDYYSDPVCLTGDPGQSISITSIKYSTATTQAQPADNTFTLDSPPTVPEGDWLWSRTLFSSGQSVYSKAKQGEKGDKGDDGISPTVSKTGDTVTITDAEGNTVTITDGQNGQSYYTYIRYATDSSGSGMSTSPSGKTYIGVYSGTSSTAPTSASSYTWSKYVGDNGQPGGTGPQGVSVTQVRELYYLTTGNAPSKPTTSTTIYNDDRVGAWTSTVPSYVVNGQYYMSLETTLSNNTKVWSDVVLDKALTTANYNAYMAQQTANSVDSLLGGHFIYGGEALSQVTPAGAYVIEQIEEGSTDVSSTPSKWHHNVTIGANGISLRYNEAVMAQLAANQSAGNTALKFYQPPTVSGNTTTQGAKAMELSGSALKFYNPSNDSIPMMQLDSSKLTFYTSAGGEIGSFGSNGLDMSGSLNIRGGGYIGVDSTNHWAFGDNRSYKDTDSAYLMGIGNASLQLGEAGHWRLDKDRIHSGWYQLSDTTRGLLHFDTGTDNNQNYYWDYGLYYPNKANNGNNKFIYVRRSTTTVTNTSLTTMKGRVDDDTWWFYKFYIDGDGNVHSPSYYIINNDGTEQTLSGSGLVASSLSCGTVGSLTQPVYFNNGVPVATTYALNAAGAKGVDTSMPTTATDNNVPTTKLMKTFVEGKGYITGYTETDPTVPSWAKASSKPTYALSEITSADDIKAIEALTGTSGFLKKTAANTWTLDTNTYLTSYTESDPTVPSWAKQSSKPSYGLTEISGTADLQAIEALTGTQGFLKKTNSNTWTLDTNTYLTSYTETDPIFTASAAANITSSDITNWNGKTSNVGTVTSVKVQGSNGLTGNGTVTSSGTITISHADTSSQASSSNSGRTYIQSITLDDYGHVTEISTATESVTDTHHTAYLYDTTSTGKVRVTTDTENPYLTLVENNTARSRVQLKAGTNVTSIVANNGVITFNVQDTKYTAATSAPGKVASSSSQGSSTNYARQDHTHGIDLATGDSNGQVKIAGTNVSVKGLGSWAYKSSGSASDVGLGNVLNIKQVTGIGQGNNGTIRVWKGTGTSDYEDIEVTIVATETSDVRSAQKLSSYGGASNRPIYIPSSGDNQGKPVAIDYTINKTVPADAKFTDTTYTFNDGTNGFTVTPLGGTAQTVNVTPSITNNVTGSGTNNYLVKWNGTNTITNGPKITSGGTGYLKEDGTWGTPGGTYSLPLAADGTRGGIQIGFSTNATNRNYAVALSSEKAYVNVPWTDTMVTTAALTSGTTYYPILADGANTKTRQIDSTLNGLRYVSTAGTSSVVGTAILQLGNTTASGSSNNEQGVIRLYGPGATYYIDLKATTISSSNKTITFPNKTGTVALSGDTSSSTTGLTIANHSTTNITGVSGSTTASKVTVGAHATDYGVKDRGSFTQGTDSFTAASYGTDSFTAASLSSGFYTVGTAASFTRGTFSQGSLPTLSMSVSGSQLIITFGQGTLPTHAADSFTANIPTRIDTTKFNGGSYSHSGFSGGSFTQGTDSYTGPTLGSKVVTVSADNVTVPKAATEITVVTSKTHTITDNGHTHSI